MVRSLVLLMFCASLTSAAYLGFASISLHHDKLIHFVTFFVLTAEFYFLWEVHRPWKLTLLVMTVGACVSSEYVQCIVNPQRVFDYLDIIYNIHGSALALAMCCVIQAYVYRRRDTSRLLESQSEEDSQESDGFVHVSLSDLRDTDGLETDGLRDNDG